MSDSVDVATVDLETTLNHIIDGLRALDDRYPQDAIASAREHRDEIVPRLIQAIHDEIAQVQTTGERFGQVGFLALLLLGEFRAKAALPAILHAISLPSEQLDELFGDVIIEYLPEILEVVSDSTDVFDELISNPKVEVFVRSAAAQAYLQAVFSRRVSREAALAKLRSHLLTAIEQRDKELVTWLVGDLIDYSPHEVMDDIREAYRRRLVDLTVITLKDFAYETRVGLDRFAAKLDAIAESRSRALADRVESWGWGRDDESSNPFRDMEFDEDDFDEDAEVDFDEVGFANPLFPAEPPPPPRVATIRHTEPRVGRNEPCPCGSGKKFKKCCGG